MSSDSFYQFLPIYKVIEAPVCVRNCNEVSAQRKHRFAKGLVVAGLIKNHFLAAKILPQEIKKLPFVFNPMRVLLDRRKRDPSAILRFDTQGPPQSGILEKGIDEGLHLSRLGQVDWPDKTADNLAQRFRRLQVPRTRIRPQNHPLQCLERGVIGSP